MKAMRKLLSALLVAVMLLGTIGMPVVAEDESGYSAAPMATVAAPALSNVDAGVMPAALAAPASDPSVDPNATPEPAPSVDPNASTEPAPSVDPNASTEPAPSVDLNASTEPAPSVDPNATPEPAPSVDPNATPEPAPSVDPNASPEALAGDSDDATEVGDEVKLTLVGISDSVMFRAAAYGLTKDNLKVVSNSNELAVDSFTVDSFSITKGGAAVGEIYDAGTYTITASGTVNGTLSFAGVSCTLEVQPYPMTFTLVPGDSLGKTYGSGDADFSACLSYTFAAVEGNDEAKLKELLDAVKLTREADENVGEYALSIDASSVSANIEATLSNPDGHKFVISKLPVTYRVTRGYSKVFGAVDPEALAQGYELVYTKPAGLSDEALKALEAEIKQTVLTRQSGEALGEYALQLKNDSVSANIDATFEAGDYKLKITMPKVTFSAVDTRSSSVTVSLEVPENNLGVDFYESLKFAVDAYLTLDRKYMNDSMIRDDTDFKKLFSYTVGGMNTAGNAYTWTIKIPTLNYAKDAYTWTAYAPEGSLIYVYISTDGTKATRLGQLNLNGDFVEPAVEVQKANATFSLMVNGNSSTVGTGTAISRKATLSVKSENGKLTDSEWLKVTLPAKGDTLEEVIYIQAKDGVISAADLEAHLVLRSGELLTESDLAAIKVEPFDDKNLEATSYTHKYAIDLDQVSDMVKLTLDGISDHVVFRATAYDVTADNLKVVSDSDELTVESFIVDRFSITDEEGTPVAEIYNAGTYTITASGRVNNNLSFTNVSCTLVVEKYKQEFYVNPKPGEDLFTKVYGAEEPEFTSRLGFVVSGTGIELIRILTTVRLMREAGEDVGDYALSINPKTVNSNIEATLRETDQKFTITSIEIKVTPDQKFDFTKVFGAVDPEDMATAYVVEHNGKGIAGKTKDQLEKEFENVKIVRVDGEAVGEYSLSLDTDSLDEDALLNSECVDLSFEDGDTKFAITQPTVEISTVDTRSDSVTVSLTAPENNLGDEFYQALNVSLKATGLEGKNLAAGQNATFDVVTAGEKDGNTYKWTFEVGELEYAKNEKEWKAYLPVGALIAVDFEDMNIGVEKDGKVKSHSKEVEKYKASISLVVNGGSYAISEEDTAIGTAIGNDAKLGAARPDGSRLLDGEWLKVTLPAKGDVTEEVVYIQLKDGEITSEQLHAHLDDSSETPDVGLLAEVKFELLDTENLETSESSHKYVIDKGAAAAQNAKYDTRGKEITDITLGELPKDGSNITVKVDGVEAGTILASEKTSDGYATAFEEWMSTTPPTLFTTGSKISISYTDRAGNTVTTDLSGKVSKTQAWKNTTINVRPEPVGNTVGQDDGRKLKIYGKGVAQEPIIVTVGGRSYSTVVSGEGNYLHEAQGNWSIKIDLAEIDFPIDVPVTISVKYRDIAGGEDSLTLIYKNWAMPIVVSAPVALDQTKIYGFAEEGSVVTIEVNGVKYTDKQGLSMGKNGYYYLDLMGLEEPLKVGDHVSVKHTDFVGNESEVAEFTVGENFDGKTFAQPMGKNVVGRYEIGDEWKSAHRYATPFDVDEMREAAENGEETSFEVPVLAYAGYEVGKMTFAYVDDQLVMTTDMNEKFLYEGAQTRMTIYSDSPEIDELVLSKHDNTDFAPVDLTDISGTIYVYVEFDVEIDMETIANSAELYDFSEGVLEIQDEEISRLYHKFQGQ